MPRQSYNNVQLGSEPNYNTGWQVLAKGGIGLSVGLVIWFLVYIIMTISNQMLNSALSNNVAAAGAQTVSPLIPLILLIIAFIATFIGNVMLTGIYNLLYSTKYYDLGKMFSNSLIANVIVFFVFTPIYLLFFSSIDTLFAILAFHVLFAIFICYTHVEILTNPNYASSHLIGTTIGVSVSALLFLVAWKAVGISTEKSNGIAIYLILLGPLLWYFCIPFFHALREKIYYQFYENGNDFLYLPTLQEISQQEEVTSQATTNEDITVDIR